MLTPRPYASLAGNSAGRFPDCSAIEITKGATTMAEPGGWVTSHPWARAKSSGSTVVKALCWSMQHPVAAASQLLVCVQKERSRRIACLPAMIDNPVPA